MVFVPKLCMKFGFGVVLLEVLCAKKPINMQQVEEQKNLVSWALKCKREGTINHIIDPYPTGKVTPQCFKIYMDIATSCVRDMGTQRPTIGEVEVGLEHALELQESADMDPGIGGGDQYMYPILEYTGTDSPPEEEESIRYCARSTSAGSSFYTNVPEEDESVCKSGSSTSAR